MTPRVSVLITTYNRERYVGDAIDSVLGQTFSDFELIVCDNCSADGTLAIAREFERRDPRVRVLVNERNLGQFGNRNRAASHARAPLIKYHDSDDIMYPHCLATMVPALEAAPEAAFAMSTGWCWPGGPCPMVSSPRLSYQREFLGLGLFMCGPACGLFRTLVFRDLGGFPDVGVHGDHLFWLKACARYTALLLPADLFWYRSHPGQLFSQPAALRDYADVAGHVWAALHDPGCPLEGDDLAQARRNQAFTVAKQTWRDLRARRFEIARRRLAHSGMSVTDWVRYLRPPRRNALAGTPLDRDGEYLVPRWPSGPSGEHP